MPTNVTLTNYMRHSRIRRKFSTQKILASGQSGNIMACDFADRIRAL